MRNIWLDHFITYTCAHTIDDYLREYTIQGFLPDDKTVRHDPGLRNGFISLGPEYIEFCWVEDEELFAKADAEDKLLRDTPRPFGVGMIAEDVNILHAAWTARGYSIPEVFSGAPRDASPEAPPRWSYQAIPAELLPGAFCFAVTYHARPKDEVKDIKIHPNTIYAISGMTFVASEPLARATLWRNLIAPDEQAIQSELGFSLSIGPHRVIWMTPDVYQSTYGLEWMPAMPALRSFGEFAVLHLLASNLTIAKNTIEQSGRKVSTIKVEDNNELLLAPDARDGFVFSIRQQSVETWSEERIARTGEKFKFIQN